MTFQYGQFSPDHLNKMSGGIQLFNQQKYWECHEVLEDLWAEDTQDPARYVYWAIIQICAVCIHYRDGNLIGCQGMIRKAREKFLRCQELHVHTSLMDQQLAWATLEAIVGRIPRENSQLEDYREIFSFRFPGPYTT